MSDHVPSCTKFLFCSTASEMSTCSVPRCQSPSTKKRTKRKKRDLALRSVLYSLQLYASKVDNSGASLVAQWLRSACQCRGRGFEPWSGKIPHAAEQLGPWATATEPARLEPVLRNERGRDGERPAHRDEEWPLLATARESPRAETKTQHSHK